VEVVAVARVPVLGEQTAVTRTTSLLEVDAQRTAPAKACRVETRGAGFVTRMPTASLDNLPESRFPLYVEGDRLSADMGVGEIGYRGGGSIPTTAKDPRVIDPDGDGKPGLRVDLDIGSLGKHPLQVVSRGHSVLGGTLDADGAGAKGRLTRILSQEVVLSGLPVQLAPREAPLDPDRTRFRLRRVEGPLDCARVRTLPFALE
jgi:hypothetical protein